MKPNNIINGEFKEIRLLLNYTSINPFSIMPVIRKVLRKYIITYKILRLIFPTYVL
jgi:hypothetical protein